MNFETYNSKQLSLPEIGTAGQQKLQNAKCLVVGAGAMGSSALFHLAGAGIGTLGICDADCVEWDSLHRQILYTTSDVGQPKATLAAEKLSKVNPYIRTHAHAEMLTAQNCAEICSQYDLILDCTDNYRTKFLLNDASYFLQIPLIRAGMYHFEGQLQCYVPHQGQACLRCIWTDPPQKGCCGSCVDIGVLGPVPGFFGTLQALETIKYFLGQPTLNGMLVYDLRSLTQKKLVAGKNPECPLCGDDPQITRLAQRMWEMDAADFSPENFQLVDIREEEEVTQDPMKRYTCLHLPYSQFDEKKLNPKGAYLFFCRKGRRSQNLVASLREKGWENVYSLKEGIQGFKK